MNAIIVPVLVLGIIALIASVLLYVLSKKFAVEEDSRLPLVIEALPGANCGGCGFPGCAGLANALIKSSNETGGIGDLSCPVGGEDVMAKIVDLLSAAVENTKAEAAPAAKAAPAAGGAPKTFKPAPVEKPFVPGKVPTVKPCQKPVLIPAGCKPADMKSLKSI